MFKPTYLYVKTHNTTGLKYFGKTTKPDPSKYTGSGFKWLNHIKKHGYDVTTEILGLYSNKDECMSVAIAYSIVHNIVESEEWANLIPETGTDESLTNLTKESVDKRTATCIEKYGNNHFSKIASYKFSEEHKQKIRDSVIQSGSGKKNLGKIREKLCCPHCNVTGSKNTMVRWHFDKCKYNTI